jgi:hypothetical protein
VCGLPLAQSRLAYSEIPPTLPASFLGCLPFAQSCLAYSEIPPTLPASFLWLPAVRAVLPRLQ